MSHGSLFAAKNDSRSPRIYSHRGPLVLAHSRGTMALDSFRGDDLHMFTIFRICKSIFA